MAGLQPVRRPDLVAGAALAGRRLVCVLLAATAREDDIMTDAVLTRLRQAVLQVPQPQRARHLEVLTRLLDLLEHHASELDEPVGFVAGSQAATLPELQWACAQLGHILFTCADTRCHQPDDVSLATRPVVLEVAR